MIAKFLLRTYRLGHHLQWLATLFGLKLMLNPRLKRINFSHLWCKRALLSGALMVQSIVGVPEDHDKFDALVQAIYDLEVTRYCGLATPAVGQGFARLAKEFINNGRLSKTDIDHARAQGWQNAHAEWQNRGLGGFRAWCANEGHTAASMLASVPRRD